MKSYSRMTLIDRYQIKALIDSGLSLRRVADQLNRSPSSVSREVKRLVAKKYHPDRADEQARLRQKNKGPQFKIQGLLKDRVRRFLAIQWSPEQIASRMGGISHEAIYQYIYRQSRTENEDLYKNLRRRRRHRRTRSSVRRFKNCGVRVNQTWIEERPDLVESRKRLGDLERDTIIGGRGRLLTIVDRTSRRLRLAKLNRHTSSDAHYATVDLLKGETVHTITNDNGPEFGLHAQTAKDLGAQVYFTRPYCSWQRGTNENTNGLIRQYFPKGMDLSLVTDEQIQMVEERLNNRPRKCLGFKTPNEVHHRLSQGVALAT